VGFGVFLVDILRVSYNIDSLSGTFASLCTNRPCCGLLIPAGITNVRPVRRSNCVSCSDGGSS
jgi:hypothetical protein